MSISKSDWSEPIKKVTAFWGLGLPVATLIAGGAVAWSNSLNSQANLRRDLDKHELQLEELKDSFERIDRNIVRIGSKVGVPDLEDPR